MSGISSIGYKISNNCHLELGTEYVQKKFKEIGCSTEDVIYAWKFKNYFDALDFDALLEQAIESRKIDEYLGIKFNETDNEDIVQTDLKRLELAINKTCKNNEEKQVQDNMIKLISKHLGIHCYTRIQNSPEKSKEIQEQLMQHGISFSSHVQNGLDEYSDKIYEAINREINTRKFLKKFGYEETEKQEIIDKNVNRIKAGEEILNKLIKAGISEGYDIQNIFLNTSLKGKEAVLEEDMRNAFIMQATSLKDLEEHVKTTGSLNELLSRLKEYNINGSTVEDTIQQYSRILDKNADYNFETGYTIYELRKLGFDEEQIEAFKKDKFDPYTGDKIADEKTTNFDPDTSGKIISRYEYVKKNVDKKRKEISLQEIGRETSKSVEHDIARATRTIEDLEQGINKLDKNDNKDRGD